MLLELIEFVGREEMENCIRSSRRTPTAQLKGGSTAPIHQQHYALSETMEILD